ncbi:MAG: outer membrane protein assembly factor BamB family protein [Planctomycetota bacterium]|jgi:outer membrane protein assembly factor BamB
MAMPVAADSFVADKALSDLGLSRFWSSRLPLTAGDSLKSVHRVDDTIYVITRNGILFSLQADVGLIRWAEKLSVPEIPISEPTHFWTEKQSGPTSVLVGEGLRIIDRYSGVELQRFDLSTLEMGSVPIGALKSLFMGGSDGRAYSYKIGGLNNEQLHMRWEATLGAPCTARPVLFGDREVLFATHAGTVVACSAVDKSLSWHFKVSEPIYGNPAVNDSGIYLSSMDRSLYKLDGQTGSLIWRLRFPCELFDGPIATDDFVYQYCSVSGVTAVDSIEGKALWNRLIGKQFVAEIMGRAAIRTGDNRIELVDLENGETVGDFTPGVTFVAATNTVDDAIYLAGIDGHVICIRPAGVPYLTESDGRNAAALLNRPPGQSTSQKSPEAESKESTPNRGAAEYLRSRRDGDN